ncbi:uncharacterized protein LOC110984330 isoform X1 [Acanthaster planci]|uniref:Uncharacterized protein LOC110984330 isoform X1 n=1 Tax=Acanthaster planci TaxID=133434 RepID=A0A8B7Z540_ACAPL|nr:uncharacterized protein LOC110984330 isoform X1 [Acanthaster planci]
MVNKMSTTMCNLRLLLLSTPMIVLSLSSVEGTACCALAVAEAGEDFTALRDKTFAAFRQECRVKDSTPCPFTTEPATPHQFDFVLRPIIPPFRLDFTLRAPKDAIVALAEDMTEDSIFAEIGIGSWGNVKSTIRPCYTILHGCFDLLGGNTVHDEAGIVSDVESRPFWIEYKGGVVTVGKGGQTEAFMEWDAASYHDKFPVPVHVGISTYQSYGNWVFYTFCK